MTEADVQGFQRLFPGIGMEAAREGFDRMMKVIRERPDGTPTSGIVKIFRKEIYDSSLRGESWAIEIGKNEGWLVVVDSDFRIEGAS